MKFIKQLFSDPADFIWLFIFCVIPFLTSSQTIDPDYVPKFFGVVFIATAAACYFAFSKLSFRIFKGNASVFFILLFCYILTAFLSLFKALNPGDDIFDAIKIVLPLLMVLVFLQSITRDENSIYRILVFQNFAVLIFSFFGARQLLESWSLARANHTPWIVELTVASTLGNKNFFAESMLMFLPFSVAAVVLLKKLWKWLSCISVLLILIEIMLLHSRSVQLALLAGIAAALLVIGLNNPHVKKIVFAPRSLAIGAVAIFIAALLISKTGMFKSSVDRISRITSTFSKPAGEEIDESNEVNRNSAYTRWFLWKNSFLIFKEHPFMGSGIGNWKMLYPKYGVSGAYFLNVGGNRFEHPHNEYLLMLSERGLIAFLLWMGILTVLLRYSFLQFKKAVGTQDKILSICMGAGIIFFIVISFFGFPLYRSYTPLLFALTLSVILSIRLKQEDQPAGFQNAFPVFAPVALFGLFSLYATYQRYEGEKYMAMALNEQSRSHFERMNKLVSAADNFFFPVDLTSTPLSWYKGFSFFYSQQVDSALIYFHQAELQSPYHLQVLNDLGACYENKGEHEKALGYFDKALKITPMYEQTMLNKIVSLYNSGRIEEAYAILHSRKYSYSLLFLSCRRSLVGAVMTSLLGNNISDTTEKDILQRLKSEAWLAAVEEKANGSFMLLQNVLRDELGIK